MKSTQPKFHTCAQALLLAILPLAVGQALAATQLLRADKFSLSLPGGSVIQMWGYVGDNGSCNSGPVYPAWTPGPAIVVPPGEGLTVTLKNCLAEATSLVIPGQVKDAMAPVWFEPSAPATTYSGARPAGNLTARVRSFDTEAAPAGGSQTYTWTSIKPGTYLYESGTHPQVQVQMGLYGRLSKNAATGNVAYRQGSTDITYSNQVALLYSEIDPVLHNAVAGGRYGQPVPTSLPPGLTAADYPSSTLEYHPKYFLINGRPFDATSNPGPLATIQAGQNALLRFLNASLKTHVPTINGQYWKMIAEDGNPYPYLSNPRQQYTAFLAPGKTMDVLLTPTSAARYSIFDSRQYDTNNGVQGGGMLAYLDVVPGTPAAPVFDSAPVTTAIVGIAYAYAAHATDPNGDAVTYSLNAGFPAGMSIVPTTGLIGWTPGVAGSYPVSVRASDTTTPTALFSNQSFNIVVASGITPNNPPTAGNDSYTAVAHPASSGLIQTVSAPGVLANDTDPDGNALHTVAATIGRVTLYANGSFALAPAGTGDGTTGTVSFNYQAFDTVSAASAPAIVNITVIANRRPTAVADAFTVPRCTTGSGTTCGGGYVPLTLNLASNDTDPDTQTIDVANQLPLAVARVRAGTSGGGSTSSITTNSRGIVTISAGNVTYRPRRNFAGTDTFRYRVKDKIGLESGATNAQGWAVVTVTVQ